MDRILTKNLKLKTSNQQLAFSNQSKIMQYFFSSPPILGGVSEGRGGK
jgi:hypothetical protein